MGYGRNFKIVAALILTAFFIVARVFAAVMDGEPVALSQPDGSEVTVHLFGTSYFSTAESPDGYTLIRDADGWICYAELSADGAEYVSTGVRYTAGSRAPNVRKGLRINERSMMEKRSRTIKALGDGEEESLRRFMDKTDRHERRQTIAQSGNPSAPPPDEDGFMYAPRSVVGLALFISFPDYPAPTGTVNSRWLLHADSVYNSPNYTRDSGAESGSIYNYFQDISGGQMDYTNYISVFVQAPQNFEYYDGVDDYGRVSELITSALNSLNQNVEVANEIANVISRHTGTFGGKSRPAIALNIHPIRSGQRWSHGIWSHRGWYRGNATIGGVPFYDYQFSGLGNSGTITNSSTLSTNIIIHENGHMLFDWPDLYSYVDGRAFVGNYCVMASGTVMPNPYLRDLEGWITVVDVTSAPGTYTHNANGNTAYIFRRTDVAGNNANRERYYIESRFSNGRSSGIPGSGLVIWHIHTGGNNTDYDPVSNRAARRTPRVAVVQANNGDGNPNANSTFTSANGRNVFDSTTTPRARWHTDNGAVGQLWSGPNNGLRVSNISAAPTVYNPSMTFTVGYGNNEPQPPATYNFSVSGGGTLSGDSTTGVSGADFESGVQITLTPNDSSNNNRYFMRWSSPTGLPISNVYASPITVTTREQNDTVRVHNALRHNLPDTVQTESFGYVSSSALTAVGTSNPALNVTGDGTAEYLVNPTAGTYDITYRVASQNGGRFFVRRLSETATDIDTVDVPATGGNTAYQTITKTGKILSTGSQVWGIVRETGTFRIDWFTAEPAFTVFTVAGDTIGDGASSSFANRAPLSFDIRSNSVGKIIYSVAKTEAVSIRVYDMRGREVVTLVNGMVSPGHYNINLSSRFGKGLFLVRMRSDSFVKDVKLNFVR